MKRVAVFGNAGGGKSTLARRLAELTRLPLYTVDEMRFADGGDKPATQEAFLKTHAELMRADEWIIDGFGSVALVFERLAAADTLVYLDLPLVTHHWFVTKRLVQGLFAPPPGWPTNTPVWVSSMQSYKVLWLCHLRLTPRYRQFVAEAAASKRVHHLKSRGEVAAFLDAIEREYVSA
jgi:adenylate kinase family enzyme